MPPRALAVTGLVAVAAALGIAACGGSDGGAGTSAGDETPVVHLYSSLPLQGPERDRAASIVKGIRLALDEVEGVAGQVAIRYTSLDDSDPDADGWDAERTRSNARKVTADPSAVGYIGDVDSLASEVSAPILNGAGITQISPTSTYDGLTRKAPGTRPGEPRTYFPSGTRTFLRLLPRDGVQATALVMQLKADRCRRTGLAHDSSRQSSALAAQVRAQAVRRKATVLAPREVDADSASERRAVSRALRTAKADCFLYTGAQIAGAVKLFKAVDSARPKARLYGASPLCRTAMTNPRQGGLPARLGERFRCLTANLPMERYGGSASFVSDYRGQYASEEPDAFALYGYEAAQLFIGAISALGTAGADRGAVRSTLFATTGRISVLGDYSFDDHGDTSAATFGIYGVGRTGLPRLLSVLEAR